jgi:hypothetical protein
MEKRGDLDDYTEQVIIVNGSFQLLVLDHVWFISMITHIAHISLRTSLGAVQAMSGCTALDLKLKAYVF